MPRSKSLLAGVVSLGIVAIFGAETACSSKQCIPSECAPGNTCIPYEQETKCRKTCTSNTDPATSCPAGYNCIDPGNGGPAFCLQQQGRLPDGSRVVPRAGQWGTQCLPQNGISNPACDGDQGFFCYGLSPTDGDAYCTRYDCTRDEECGPGMYCGKVNQTPNVENARRATIGEVQSVCLKRAFCAPCRVDLDCPPLKGKPQHCIPDINNVPFCSPECDASSNCNNEAGCADLGIGVNVCFPRAQVCVGDGSICSPCRNDADCGEDGVCVKGQYTTERACAKKSTRSCNDGEENGSCPQRVQSPAVSVRCLGGIFDEVPKDYCHGIYTIAGTGGDIGCWTPKR